MTLAMAERHGRLDPVRVIDHTRRETSMTAIRGQAHCAPCRVSMAMASCLRRWLDS